MDSGLQGAAVSGGAERTATVDLSFPHRWQAEILTARPLILPPRHFIYPREVEEIERGALEVLVRAESENTQPFLATCALGFRDPAVPTGSWSTPNPDEICALSGGYAYLIDTTDPERFTMLLYRPVLEVRPLPDEGLLLFVGHHSILAWGPNGEAWESDNSPTKALRSRRRKRDAARAWLGSEADKETPFALDLERVCIARKPVDLYSPRS